MRVKSFEAESMNKAMHLIRESLGEEAVIISTTRNREGGVQVTAAVEAEADEPVEEAIRWEEPAPRFHPPEEDMRATEQEETQEPNQLHRILTFHNAPGYLAEQLWHSGQTSPAGNTETTMLHVLEHNFGFDPLFNDAMADSAIMLVGPPGVGKTMTCAKIATQAVMNKQPITVIGTDTNKAGGMEQLQSFTNILDIPLKQADSPAALKRAIREAPANHMVLIDTAGVSPYHSKELQGLGALIAADEIEPILVCNAGMDVHEASDMASNFAYLGIDRLIVTKIDATRRLGGVLTAAHAGNLAFSHFSSHAGAVEGLEPVTPIKLATLLMQRVDQSPR